MFSAYRPVSVMDKDTVIGAVSQWFDPGSGPENFGGGMQF